MRPPRGGGHIQLFLFQPITTADREHYSGLLRLSQAQIAHFDQLFAEYVQRDAALRGEHVHELWIHSTRVRERHEAENLSLELALEIDALFAARARVLKQLSEGEDFMFDALTEVLSDDQLARFRRVLDRRRRDRCVFRYLKFPGAYVDLEHVVDRLCRPERPALAVRDWTAMEKLLDDYSARATPLFEQREATSAREISEGRRAMYESYELIHGGTQSSAEVVAQLRERAWEARERVTPACRTIQELNHEFVDRIAVTLAPTDIDRFVAAYRSTVYPVVYPNPFDVRHAFDALDDLALDDARTIEFNSLREWYVAEEERVATRMLGLFLDWRARPGPWRRRAEGQEAYDEYRRKMVALQQLRAHHRLLVREGLAAGLAPHYLEQVDFGDDYTVALLEELERQSAAEEWPPR